jgi:prophage regulatory protein
MSDYMSVAHDSGGRLRDRSAPGFRAPMENSQQPEHLLRLRDVVERTRLSRSTIYRLIDGGRFPKPFRVGDFAVRWKSSMIDGWIADLSLEKIEVISGGTVGGIEIEPLEKTE